MEKEYKIYWHLICLFFTVLINTLQDTTLNEFTVFYGDIIFHVVPKIEIDYSFTLVCFVFEHIRQDSHKDVQDTPNVVNTNYLIVVDSLYFFTAEY